MYYLLSIFDAKIWFFGSLCNNVRLSRVFDCWLFEFPKCLFKECVFTMFSDFAVVIKKMLLLYIDSWWYHYQILLCISTFNVITHACSQLTMDHSYSTEREKVQKADHSYFTIAKKTPKVVLRRAQLLKELQNLNHTSICQDHSYVRSDHLPSELVIIDAVNDRNNCLLQKHQSKCQMKAWIFTISFKFKFWFHSFLRGAFLISIVNFTIFSQ